VRDAYGMTLFGQGALTARRLALDRMATKLAETDSARTCWPELVDLINDVRATGISIVWIEHVVHALIAVVDRLVVLHGGVLIAEGDPAEVIRRPQVSEIYMGIEEGIETNA